MQYPAPGLPDLAEEIADVVEPTWVGAGVDSRGIDHGTWSVLVHPFPDHSVPVVQLPINAHQPLDYHLELGASIAPLRERGILILGSGNIVHNLGAMDPSLPDTGFDWARRFDDDARAQFLDDPAGAVRLREHPDYTSAVPMPDHPMLSVAGLAAAQDDCTGVLDCAYGSLSMTSYTVGVAAQRWAQNS